MSKKTIIAAAVAALAFGQMAQAQTNLQTFYDFGKNRGHFTTTLEGFYNDNWGNTFFFIDYDYNQKVDNKNVAPSGSYMEIARCLNFWGNTALAPLSLQVEYNGLVREYYHDAMPHIGTFYAVTTMEQETRFSQNEGELPLYGGMEEALHSYLGEREFREFYSVFLRAADMEMTHRERVIYEKTRQFVSFTFLEMCRMNGLKPGGFAELVGDEWVVKPEVWAAVEDLKLMTDEDDVYLLTGNESTSMDHMDRVNESGVYVADYENEVELWLNGQMWMQDYLLRQPLRVHAGDQFFTTTYLTDGVAGISQNYHWGWQIYNQQDCYIELPVDAIAGKSER